MLIQCLTTSQFKANASLFGIHIGLMRLITRIAQIWYCRILRIAGSKFMSRRSGCSGFSRCLKKANVILSPTLLSLKTVMSSVPLWQSKMLFLCNLLLAERYEGLLLLRIQNQTSLIVRSGITEQTYGNMPRKGMSLAMLYLFFNLGKYKLIMRIIDQLGSAPIVFFNTRINKLSGYTAWELLERHGIDVDEYWPGELLDLVGKKDSEDDFTTPANKIKVNDFTDDSLNRMLKMPPPSIEIKISLSDKLDLNFTSITTGAVQGGTGTSMQLSLLSKQTTALVGSDCESPSTEPVILSSHQSSLLTSDRQKLKGKMATRQSAWRINFIESVHTKDKKENKHKFVGISQDYIDHGDSTFECSSCGELLWLIGTRQRDGRQYNLLTTSEVAALIFRDFDSTEHKRVIILHCQDGDFKRISLKSEDRHDVISRVFKIELDCLMNELNDGHKFGRVKGDKITTTRKIDEYIAVETPNKDEDPELYQLVTYHIMHGPCGADNPSCPCTIEYKCTKKFPRQFRETTVIDDSDYALYKRRNDGNIIKKSGTDLHNGYEVPYNPGLLRRYHAHINIQWCNQVGSIKYLFKYISKGPDKVGATVDDEEVDEIKDFLNCRYIGPMEWDDIKKVDDVLYPTYQDACYAQGLLQDDKEYIDRILEASFWGICDYLRSIFVMLFMTDSMSRLEIVWEKTWMKLAEDVLNVERIKQGILDLELSDIQRKNICLSYIDCMLRSNNMSLNDIQNMHYPDQEYTVDGYNKLIYDETSYNKDQLREQHVKLYGSLTKEKKTYLYKTMSAALRYKGDIVLNVDSSDIASLLLEAGRTTHSRFAIPINAPMINRHCYEAFDRTLRDIYKTDPFIASDKVSGGNVVLFADNMLIPETDDDIGAIIDDTYPNLLQNLGNPSFFQEKAILAPTHEMVDIINERMLSLLLGDENEYESSNFVCLANEDSNFDDLIYTTEFLNDLRMSGIPNHSINIKIGEEIEYESSDFVCLADEDLNFDDSIYTTEFLNGLRMSSIPNHSIKLKIEVMSSASSAVTYTSVYIDSEPGRVFWGADEELSDGGSSRVIVYGYDGPPMLLVAPPSPDYIPGPEEPQTPPAPQDEDEHEPMFIQPHDPDFVLEPIYPEYIPLEDEHILLAKEQLLPPVVSPTAKSPEYVAESDPKEDPKEYKDDETEDGPIDYPIDGGDDDDGDSSGDDADDEDEDEEDEEEEEHLAPADSAVIIPTDKLISSPEGTEPVMPPPSTDTTITGARITVRLQAVISFPPEAEVERLLAMPTPSPSPPSTRERLTRCTAPTALPSPLLPPPLYIPPPIDCRDDILETEMPPRKRLCLSTLGSRDTWVDPTETVPKIAPMTVGEVNTKVIELAELYEHDTHDLYALLEDAQDSRTRISQQVDVESQRVDLLNEDRIAHQETIQIVEEEAYAA
nr:ATP-dependent DNA helicase PIF1-like [Tanacetum cinerariifolium]